LVDEDGIIKTVNLSGHVIVDESCDPEVIEHSALRDIPEVDCLHQIVSEHE